MYNIPEMIIFDYGQTLISEEKFDALKGNKALLDIAIKNPNTVTPEQVQELANGLSKDIGEALNSKNRSNQKLEVSDYAFNKYLYEYLEVEFSVDQSELEWRFWNSAAPGKPTKNVEILLDYLYQKGIRTAVVSNMMNSTESLTRRLNELLPNNYFEFVIASSDYIFRKPHRRIFELALKKANILADKVWFCGDNLVCDVEGSYHVGMKPIWYPAYIDVDDKVTTKVPYMQVNDWNEIVDIIEIQTKQENLLLKVDTKDYFPDGTKFKRIAVRGFIKNENKYAMIHSSKYGEYKFPGGGMKSGEQLEDTLVREIEEETGLTVVRNSIKYIGRVEELRKGDSADIFEMTSHYYECDVTNEIGKQKLDNYEEEYGYELEYVTLEQAIRNNENIKDTSDIPWIVRDTAVMRWLVEIS